MYIIFSIIRKVIRKLQVSTSSSRTASALPGLAETDDDVIQTTSLTEVCKGLELSYGIIKINRWPHLL